MINVLTYQILTSNTQGKIYESHMKVHHFEYILITSLVSKKHEAVTDNTQIRICVNKTEIFVNKTENRITFKIRTGLELWTSEIMKLLGSGNIK